MGARKVGDSKETACVFRSKFAFVNPQVDFGVRNGKNARSKANQ